MSFIQDLILRNLKKKFSREEMIKYGVSKVIDFIDTYKDNVQFIVDGLVAELKDNESRINDKLVNYTKRFSRLDKDQELPRVQGIESESSRKKMVGQDTNTDLKRGG